MAHMLSKLMPNLAVTLRRMSSDASGIVSKLLLLDIKLMLLTLTVEARLQLEIRAKPGGMKANILCLSNYAEKRIRTKLALECRYQYLVQ